jgi:hypothetical protein
LATKTQDFSLKYFGVMNRYFTQKLALEMIDSDGSKP